MGLKGNLSTVSLSDVFQLLNRGRSTGVLKIETPMGIRMVEMDAGKIAAVANTANPMRLGELLQSRGLITAKQLSRGLMHQKLHQIRLGEALIQLGFFPPDKLQDVLMFQVQEDICEIFLFEEGEFEFSPGEKIPDDLRLGGGAIDALRINPDAVLLEAARRSDEWKSILAKIPSPASLFLVTDLGQDYYRNADLDTQVIMTLLNEQRTFESCVQKSYFGRFRTGQLISELLDVGAIQHLPFENYIAIADRHLLEGRPDEAARIYRYSMDYIPDKSQREHAAQQLGKAEERIKAVAAFEDNRTEIVRVPGMQLERTINWPYVIAGGLLLIFSVIGLFVFLGSPADEEASEDTATVTPPAKKAKPPTAPATPDLATTGEGTASAPSTQAAGEKESEPAEANTSSRMERDKAAWKTVESAGNRIQCNLAHYAEDCASSKFSLPRAAENLVNLSASTADWLRLAETAVPARYAGKTAEIALALSRVRTEAFDAFGGELAGKAGEITGRFRNPGYKPDENIAAAAQLLEFYADVGAKLPDNWLEKSTSRPVRDAVNLEFAAMRAYYAYWSRKAAAAAGKTEYSPKYNAYILALEDALKTRFLSWRDRVFLENLLAAEKETGKQIRTELEGIRKRMEQNRWWTCRAECEALSLRVKVLACADLPVNGDEANPGETVWKLLDETERACDSAIARQKAEVDGTMSIKVLPPAEERKKYLGRAEKFLRGFLEKKPAAEAKLETDYKLVSPYLARVYYFYSNLKTAAGEQN